MVVLIKDNFLDLEKHRQLLEDNIEKLRKSLRHWQTWEAEYEGLKEEILAAIPPPNRSQLVLLAQGYEGDLVNRTEVNEILGPATRGAAQVVNILERRLDYVEKNVKTAEKQVEVAEYKLAAATIISTPDVRNEEGLPLTEIMEELDEEGNVISSHTSTPGSAKPQLLDVLKKAGVNNLPLSNTSPKPKAINTIEYGRDSDGSDRSGRLVEKAAKKGVKFTEDTKSGPELKISSTAKRVEEIMKIAKKSEVRSTEPPIIPIGESSEDADLRKEMLRYGVSEVGAVVAELNLEEGSDWSEYDEDISTDDEDAFGRSTGSIVDDELRQRMIELEQRLGARVMENIGNKASDPGLVKEGIGRVSIRGVQGKTTRADNMPNDLSTASILETKKAVRFSEDLDISPPPQHEPKLGPFLETTAMPLSDIVERSPSVSIAQTHTAPSGPQGRTLAATVVERDVALDTIAAEPDELDPQLLHQEVATEYHRLRNRMIQRQGGFMKEEESEIMPFSEEEGGPKKMSRFKAARLARS